MFVMDLLWSTHSRELPAQFGLCVFVCAQVRERKEEEKIGAIEEPHFGNKQHTHTHKKETNEGTRRKKTQQQQQRDVEQNE